MKLDTSPIVDIAKHLGMLIKKHSLSLIIIITLTMSALLILNIKNLANKEPSDTLVAEKMQEKGQLTKIDDSLVNKIKTLNSSDIEIQSLFDQARDNPFQE